MGPLGAKIGDNFATKKDLTEFVNENIETNEDGIIKKDELYQHFSAWYKEHYGRNVPKGKEIFDFINKGWKNEELIAYFKTLMDLSLADGHFDEQEKHTLVKNMREIGWNPSSQDELNSMLQKAKNMSITQQFTIIKAMSLNKRNAISLGLKLLIIADKEISKSELDYVKKLTVRANIPEVKFTKYDLEKYKEKSVSNHVDNNISNNDFHQNAMKLFEGFEVTIFNLGKDLSHESINVSQSLELSFPIAKINSSSNLETNIEFVPLSSFLK